MATTNPKTPMAVLRIGYEDYALPMAKAMKVMELLSAAGIVERNYDAADKRYIFKGEVKLEMTMIRPDQLVMPEGSAQPVKCGRGKTPLLGHAALKLEG